jgi:hypothetical protein
MNYSRRLSKDGLKFIPRIANCDLQLHNVAVNSVKVRRYLNDVTDSEDCRNNFFAKSKTTDQFFSLKQRNL